MLDKLYKKICELMLNLENKENIIEKKMNKSSFCLSFSNITNEEIEYIKKIKYYTTINVPVYTIDICFNKRESLDTYYLVINFIKYNSLGKNEESILYPIKKRATRTLIINEDLTMYSVNETIIRTNNKKVSRRNSFPTSFSELSKLLGIFTESIFKDIICLVFDFFSEKHILFKDIAAEYKKQNIYLPIQINEVRNFYNKKDLIQNHCKAYPTPKTINKYSLQLGYLLTKCKRYVSDKNYQKLLLFFKTNKVYIPKYYFIRTQIQYIFYLYYIHTIDKSSFKKENNDFDNFEILLNDFIYMKLNYTKSKIFNLNIKSAKRIKQEHDDMIFEDVIKQTPIIKIPKDSKFNKLELPKEFERIINRKRIVKEAMTQHNCVASYANRINKDICAIYSIIYENHRYTIEILKRQNFYTLRQVFGISNTPAPEKLVLFIKNILKENNVKTKKK